MKTHADKGWSRDFAKVVEDMCCQSLHYQKDIRIEGVLAITLDESEVVVVNVNRQTKGKNEQCIIPSYSTTPEQPDTVTPMLSRLFSGVSCVSGQPPHVAVTGLGTSNLVGQLVITSSPDGKVPQAKLILNDQNLPVSTYSEKSKVSQKNSNEAISSTTSSNDTPNGNYNTNNSVSSSSNAAKKSLDSVIAKLHHQSSGSSQVDQAKSGSSTVTKKRQSVQPTIIRRVAQVKTEILEHTEKESKTVKAPTIVRKVKDRAQEEEITHPPVKRKRVDSLETPQSSATNVKEATPQQPTAKVAAENRREVGLGKSTQRNTTPLRDTASSASGRNTPSIEGKGRAKNTPTREVVKDIEGKSRAKNTPARDVALDAEGKGRVKNTPTREIPSRQAKTLGRESIGEVMGKSAAKEPQRGNKTPSESSTTKVEKRISVRAKRPKDLFAPDDSTRTTYMANKLTKTSSRLTRQRKVAGSKLAPRQTSAQSQAKKIVKKHQNRKQQQQQKPMKMKKSLRQTGSDRHGDKGARHDPLKVFKRQKNKCLKCPNCKREDDCEECIFCLDKPKYGGKNTLRQKCIKKQCIRLSRHLKKPKQTGK